MPKSKQKKPYAKEGARIAEDKASIIRDHLDLVLSSEDFKATPAQKNLLRFVVEKAIAGEIVEIKAYTIATQVFDRNQDFNQAEDPIVSVQAGRLRTALQDYYNGAGKRDPMKIEIPVGAYVPTFHVQSMKNRSRVARAQTNSEILPGGWPTVLIRPFENLSGDGRLNYLSIGLATELAMELSRYQDFKVLREPLGMAAEFISRKPIDYIIRGAIRKEGPRFKVSVELIDKATGVQLWGTSRSHVINGPELLAFEEETARVIAANIASERGIIALNLSKETRAKPPSKYTSYDAMLKFYEFESVLSDKVYLDALKALETAAPVEADCDQLCSMLGRLHAINYSHEFFPQPDSLVKAFRYAEKGVALNPENQRARTILAFCMMLSNEITPALKELQKALELNPQSLLFNDSIGYVMALCGEFERGVELILSNMRLNPYYNPTVHYALYCNWIRTGQYEQAYLETHHMRRRLHFWDPLLRAAILGLLGKVDEGKVAANELLRLKPNFQERSMVLMKHYLKFDEILDPILSGLRNVGLKID